ncbi:MAG TPA: hypothetical protein DHV08_04005 [Rhodocyclaceae bacterium]|nr:MAG: hypothetical protein AUK49_12780 [Betaproteobacteria bacterium CG2_30_68_42]PJA58142.1 MAG: hypothetical protein CO164_04085 [Rhodocyclales bacterium CG_4_9_14_3_um_filter_68_10]HCX32778.1 hypothetical protein [Rhodocyclaceae bacterium]
MKGRLLILCAAAAALSQIGSAAAAGIDERQANQERRIQQGLASGQLTEREAARLRSNKVERMQERAQGDGVVTPRERARIQHQQDVQSRRIYKQKHDRQRDLNHDGVQDRPARSPRSLAPS